MTATPKTCRSSEAGELLGVSRQRLHQLAAKDPNFPAPVENGPSGQYWLVREIKAYGKKRNTQTGRPRKLAAK